MRIRLAYGDSISAEQWFGDRSKALIALHGSAENVTNPHVIVDAAQLDALIVELTRIRAALGGPSVTERQSQPAVPASH